MSTIKREFEFESYKNCSEAIQIENKISHLRKTHLAQVVLKEIKKN